MKLDLIHDIQIAYRKTVDAMSRPGLISNIKEQADKVEPEIGCFNSTIVLALMLLDTEVTFKVISLKEIETTKLINQLTYSKATKTQSADFIFVLQDARPLDLERAIKEAKPGSLLNPHQAATLIVEVDKLSNDRDLVLTGPGIDKESYLTVQTIGSWVDIRAEKNAEYPLGIDFIFTDLNNNILCLPRTTQVMKQVVG